MRRGVVKEYFTFQLLQNYTTSTNIVIVIICVLCRYSCNKHMYVVIACRFRDAEHTLYIIIYTYIQSYCNSLKRDFISCQYCLLKKAVCLEPVLCTPTGTWSRRKHSNLNLDDILGLIYKYSTVHILIKHSLSFCLYSAITIITVSSFLILIIMVGVCGNYL